MLAGLFADGDVTVKEPAQSRDHSERMLRLFAARVETRDLTTTISPGRLSGASVTVPGDISSAAFLLVAGLLVPDARVTVTAVGLNPTRTGVLETLSAMGAGLQIVADAQTAGEPSGAITAATSALGGGTVGGALVPRLIDEVPALTVAAALARGRTEIRDAAELRVKESDRVAALARGLGAMGASITERPDGLVHEDVRRAEQGFSGAARRLETQRRGAQHRGGDAESRRGGGRQAARDHDGRQHALARGAIGAGILGGQEIR